MVIRRLGARTSLHPRTLPCICVPRCRRQEQEAAADRRQAGTSSSEEDDFDAESEEASEEASEAASNEVSSPGGSPGETANASVYEGDEAETLEDLMAAR